MKILKKNLRLRALISTGDGRITRGRVYDAEYIRLPWWKFLSEKSNPPAGLYRVRIKVDNYGETMNFNPSIFMREPING